MNKTVDLLVAAQKDMMLIVRMTTLGVLARAGGGSAGKKSVSRQ